MLCERGIRTFETYTRNTYGRVRDPGVEEADVTCRFVADPSHGVGKRDLVPPMALASVAAGADGLLMEMHPEPGQGDVGRRTVALPGAIEAKLVEQAAPSWRRSSTAAIAPAVAQVHA
jgi:3-deoxy-7-phosphoheptulonate synthase